MIKIPDAPPLHAGFYCACLKQQELVGNKINKMKDRRGQIFRNHIGMAHWVFLIKDKKNLVLYSFSSAE